VDWDRAKNIIIVLLLMINTALFVISLRENGIAYRLTKEQRNDILTFLENNDIEFRGEIINDFKPQKKIVLKSYEFEQNLLKSVFFKDEEVKESFETRYFVFQNDSGMLFIDELGNMFDFTPQTPQTYIENFNRESAEKVCTDMISSLGSEFSQYKIDKVFSETENGEEKFIFYYRDFYKGKKMYCNSIRFAVGKTGLLNVSAEHYKIEEFEGRAKEIRSSDEAILEFYRYYSQMLYSEEEIAEDRLVIENIELVYSLEEHGEEGTINAIPYYSIYTSWTEETPILINAYNLTLT